MGDTRSGELLERRGAVSRVVVQTLGLARRDIGIGVADRCPDGLHRRLGCLIRDEPLQDPDAVSENVVG